MAQSAVSTAEVQSLRAHLGYGNIAVSGYPYTPDGWYELFSQVIAPNLQSGEETTGSTAVTAGSTTTVTVASITDIVPNARVVVDVGDDAEVVAVKSVSGSTFTASFTKAHPASGYPVAVESGVTRLRLLLAKADKAWEAIQDPSVGKTAGLKRAEEVEWYQGGGVLAGKQAHYQAIRAQISSLVRVPVVCASRGSSSTEAY